MTRKRIADNHHESGAALHESPYDGLKEKDLSIFDYLDFLRYFFQSPRNKMKQINSLISSDELYDFIVELLEILMNFMKGDHYRHRISNSDVIFTDMVDELANLRSFKVKQKHTRVSADPMEIQGLQFIIENLISLKRNRSLTREAKRQLEVPPTDRKSVNELKRAHKQKPMIFDFEDLEVLKEAKEPFKFVPGSTYSDSWYSNLPSKARKKSKKKGWFYK